MNNSGVVLLIVAGFGPWLYFQYRVPAGVTPKGDSSDMIALMGLIGGIVSLLTSIVGLLQKNVDLRASAKSK